MLWRILRQSGASNSKHKHTNKLYIQTCNMSSKLFLIPLCTLIHLYLALKPEQMLSFYICHNCTFCIIFTCIFMKTNKPHSDLNTLSKNNSTFVHLETANTLLFLLKTSMRLGCLYCGQMKKQQGVSGSVTSFPGLGSPHDHLLLLIALTLSSQHGHCLTFVAHFGFVL